MSRIFFRELEVPEPDADLGVGSGSHAEQTAKMMVKLEEVINRYKPRMVIALGDTNTVVATALTSSKLGIPFAHLEAGMRSWDRSMPEEINRVIADHVADVLFAFTRLAQIYLAHEGISLDKIFVTGSTKVDVIYRYWDEIGKKGKSLVGEYDLSSGEYVIVTVHRQSNVDNPAVLTQILSALSEIAEKYQVKIVFPVHPRTRKAIATYGVEHVLNSKNILPLPPLGYFEFLGLLKYAGIVLTDSGGVQVDACTLKIPTIVLRYNTEYPECVILGIAELAGTRKEDIVSIFENYSKRKQRCLNTLILLVMEKQVKE